jgi:hypothetical protein
LQRSADERGSNKFGLNLPKSLNAPVGIGIITQLCCDGEAEVDMIRTQILLLPEQDRNLREAAALQGKSISEVVRDILDAYFAEQQRQKREAALQALAELEQIRNTIAEEVGVYQGDPLNEARQEREKQQEAVWKQSS